MGILTALTKRDAQSFSDLLDLCFALPKGSRFLDDFPIWDFRLDVPRVERVGIFNQNQLVACAGVRLTQMTPGVPIALIGAVATHPQWRGKGLASQCVSHLIEVAQRSSVSQIVLWSSSLQLYQKLGFDFYGEQIRLLLEDIQMHPLLSGGPVSSLPLYDDVHEGWNPYLFTLLQKREGGLLLSETDRLWFEAHKNVRWFYTGSFERPSAYAALGRGIDLGGVIHEWGGERLSLFKIFRRIHQVERNVTLLGSEHPF